MLFDAGPKVTISTFARNLLYRHSEDLTSVVDLDVKEPLSSELVSAALGMPDWTMQDLGVALELSLSTIRGVQDPAERVAKVQPGTLELGR